MFCNLVLELMILKLACRVMVVCLYVFADSICCKEPFVTVHVFLNLSSTHSFIIISLSHLCIRCNTNRAVNGPKNFFAVVAMG